jgi:hypothetical protein
MFDKNNTDCLSKLFSNLSFDIQEKIYNETLIIQDTERNKRYFSGIVLSELKYNWDNVMFKDGKIVKTKDSEYGMYLDRYMNNVYEFLDCGKRIIEEKEEEYCVMVDYEYDKLYYDNLDYLLKCNLNTIISKEINEISFDYKLKDIYKYQEKYYNSLDSYDNDWRLLYSCNSMCYDLYDFCECNIGEYDNELDEMLEDNFNNTNNEEIKSLLYCLSNRKIFYGKNDIVL